MPLTAKLVVVGGDVKTAEINLRLPSTIGRGRGATIMLAHPLVSRQHCELYEANGQLMVRDLGSLNGTFVNNQRVTESAVPPGELLTIGTVTFRAVYESESQVGPPPGPAPQFKASRPQDTDPNGTLRAEPKSKTPSKPAPAAKAPEPASATPLTEDAEGFDFGPPLQALDEDEGNGGDPKTAIQGVQPPPQADELEELADDEELSPPSKTSAAKSAQPAAPSGSKDGEEADEEDTEDDDDFDDFLKSLGK